MFADMPQNIFKLSISSASEVISDFIQHYYFEDSLWKKSKIKLINKTKSKESQISMEKWAYLLGTTGRTVYTVSSHSVEKDFVNYT